MILYGKGLIAEEYCRYPEYVGELLTTVFFAHHMGKWRTEYIDYHLLKEI